MTQLGPLENYFIRSDYKPRLNNAFFDDSANTDEWQKEVYEFAAEVAKENGYKYVCDIGCGSGYKLTKYFDWTDRKYGIDLPIHVQKLREKYPNGVWLNDVRDVCLYEDYVDFVIAADVIEHMLDPMDLIGMIKCLRPKRIVLSTPDRWLVHSGYELGPPQNKAHVREWTMPEFRAFIAEYFDVEKHFISNKEQATQCILCKAYE